MTDPEISQPWGDERLKIGGTYIGCVTKQNADKIMRLQRRVCELEKTVTRLLSASTSQFGTNFGNH